MLKIFAKRNKNSQSGATAIEAAFVLPIFIALLFVMIESSLLFYYQVAIDAELNRAVREVKVTTGSPSKFNGGLEEMLRDRVVGLMNPSKLYVVADVGSGTQSVPIYDQCIVTTNKCSSCSSYMEKNGVTGCQDNSTTSTSEDFGEPGNIVRVTAAYSYNPITPFLGRFFGSKAAYGTGTRVGTGGTTPGTADGRINENILQTGSDGEILITAGTIFRNEL